MIYSELVKSVNAIMDGELRLPTDISYENKILNNKWAQSRATQIYSYRRWQLLTMGFQQFSVIGIIETMYGQHHTRKWHAQDRHKYEWVYNHHTGHNEKRRWTHLPEFFVCEEMAGFFHWPPLKWKMLWKCKVANLNEISCEVPPAIVLKILRLQALNVLNAFHVIEPINSSKPPVLLGTLWELPPSFEGRQTPIYMKTGYVTHFFLSEWC